MKDCRILGFIVAAILFCVAGRSVWAQHAEEQTLQPSSSLARELALLKQRLGELEAAKTAHENATGRLNQRIEELEKAKLVHEDATRRLNQRLEELEGLEAPRIAHKDASRVDTTRRRKQGLEELEAPRIARKDVAQEDETLKQRVEELEKAKLAQEDAARTIIRRSFAERASSINDYVDFNGVLEGLVFRTKDFTTGAYESNISFQAADLEFIMRVNDWTSGNLVLNYDTSANVLRPTVGGRETSVDRINVREALVTLGNTERFPLFGRAGRAVVPFGVSTGHPVTSTLSLVDPLTIEVFETREDFLMFGFEGPTPPLPPPLAVTPIPSTRVRPLLINPLVGKFGTWLCSSLRCNPPSPKPVPPAIPLKSRPPYAAAIYVYKGDTSKRAGDYEFGATLGYRTKGIFSQRKIPWAIDFDVDFNSSVFDSNFLQFGYQHFLRQIGFVPGMAAHFKSYLGPIGFIVEWNGAIDNARFTNDQGKAISIRPNSWQVQFAYQFDYHPYVESIGAQGTYIVVGYSESEDLAGVTQVIDMEPKRVGFIPARRLTVGAGEWVLENLRVALEYSHDWDYSIGEGGTGNSGNGIFGQLTYEW